MQTNAVNSVANQQPQLQQGPGGASVTLTQLSPADLVFTVKHPARSEPPEHIDQPLNDQQTCKYAGCTDEIGRANGLADLSIAM